MTSRDPLRRVGHPDEGGPGAPRPASMSDEEIVRLWRAHRRWVAAVLQAHKPRDVDLEDLLQDVAVKLVRNIHTLDNRDSIRPWLRTVAINAARSAGRRMRSRRTAHNALRHEHDDGALRPTTADGAAIRVPSAIDEARHDEGESRRRGRRALELAETLPPHYREPLMLSLRGLSQKQISEVMDVPVTTVETRLIRARRMIREELLASEAADRRCETPSPSARVITLDS